MLSLSSRQLQWVDRLLRQVWEALEITVVPICSGWVVKGVAVFVPNRRFQDKGGLCRHLALPRGATRSLFVQWELFGHPEVWSFQAVYALLVRFASRAGLLLAMSPVSAGFQAGLGCLGDQCRTRRFGLDREGSRSSSPTAG